MRRLTTAASPKKEFVIGLIEQALEEAEEEFEAARADEYEEQIEGCRESTADEDAEPDDIEETDESPKKKPTHKKARNSLQDWEIPISAGCFHIYISFYHLKGVMPLDCPLVVCRFSKKERDNGS